MLSRVYSSTWARPALEAFLPSVSPGLGITVRVEWCITLNICLGELAADRSQPDCALYTEGKHSLHCHEGTEIVFCHAGDVARPPGLSDWTANVYGECFYKFRNATGLLCVAQSSTLSGELPQRRREASLHCAGYGKTLPSQC